MRINFWSAALLSLAACASVAACREEQNFSQMDGFEEMRRARAGASLPDAREVDLLRRHRPRLFLARGQEPPLDFYRDYIAHGRLYDSAGDLVAAAVDSETLNRYRDDPGAIFAHEPPLDGGVSPRAYGGVARVTLAVADEPPFAATVLTYHFAFRHSGLPAKIAPWKKALLGFGARDWHQLDHYTAVFIALDSRQNPAAVMLQQHNYLRAWLIGEDPAFAPGRRIEIDAAIDSNELYPHRAKRAFWRSANFMSAKTFPWLARIADSPPNFYCCGEDETRGEIEQEYEIETLPPDDAFYVFEGRLGERRWLPGRDGPPGAIYNTWPALAKIELMLPVFYWRDNDREYAEILKLPLAESITAALERDAARALLARLRG